MTGEGSYTDARWMELSTHFLSLFSFTTPLWHNFRCRKRFQEQWRDPSGSLRPSSSHVPLCLLCFGFSPPFSPHRGERALGAFWPTWGWLQVWCPQTLRAGHSLTEPQPRCQTRQLSLLRDQGCHQVPSLQREAQDHAWHAFLPSFRSLRIHQQLPGLWVCLHTCTLTMSMHISWHF